MKEKFFFKVSKKLKKNKEGRGENSRGCREGMEISSNQKRKKSGLVMDMDTDKFKKPWDIRLYPP